MSFKRIDLTRPRCPECNEPFAKKDPQKYGVCNWCNGNTFATYDRQYKPDRTGGGMGRWLTLIRKGESSVYPPMVNLTSEFWWNE